ncbi:MAG: hypothetical protein K2W95_26235 [Candidatus Obscuribacterales bacterium]|nr:hypothetical protein [Candidatus Obscuribacterales bacterium]
MRRNTLSHWVALTIVGTALPVMAETPGDVTPRIIDAGSHSSTTPLTVQAGQTVVIDFASNANLTLPDTFTNAGTVYLTSSNQNITSGTLTAANISNLAGGVITSILPTGGIAGMPNLLPSFSFTLNALDSIMNSGSITSSANLAMIAGGTITNTSAAVMSAVQNINLTSLAGLTNAGNIASLIGNINIDTASLQNSALIKAMAGSINVTNTIMPQLGVTVLQDLTGTIQALNQTITAQTLNQALKEPLTISGGTLAAGEIILNAGEGHLALDINDINGPLSISAGSASVAVRNGTNGFSVNQFNITGDPDLIYKGSGPFTFGAFNSLGGKVDIDTSADTTNGSITFTGNVLTNQTGAGPSGTITLNAGTTVNATNLFSTTPSGGNTGAISIRAVKDIVITANVSSLSTNGSAGDVSIISTEGNVSLQAVATTGTVNSGSIAIAGKTVTTAGAILSSNITAGGKAGDITIFAQQNFAGTSFNASGPAGAGNIYIAAGTSGTGNLTTTGITAISTAANGGSVTLVSSNSITTGAVQTQSIGASGQISAIAGGAGLPSTITMGNLTTVGSLPGQVVLVNMSGDALIGVINTASPTGTGADVSITAAGNISTNQISTGGATFGGDIWFSAGATSGMSIISPLVTRAGGIGNGQFFAIHNSGAATNINLSPGIGAADFIGTPTGIVSSITGNTTLSVTNGAVTGYAPGGFTSINAPGGTLTLNQPVRVPVPIVARSGGINLAAIVGSPALPANQTLNLVAHGDINVGSQPSVPGGIVRVVSSNGQVTLPSINVSGALPIPGAILVSGNSGINLLGGASLATNGTGTPGGPIALVSPAGSINSVPTASINSSGNIGGAITLIAANQVNTNNATLNSSGSPAGTQTVRSLNLVPPALPQSVPSAIAAITSQPTTPPSTSFLAVAFITPVTAGNGTILPTDTLPVDFSTGASLGPASRQSQQDNERLAIIMDSDFSTQAVAKLTAQGMDCFCATASNSLILNGGSAVFAPNEDIVVIAAGIKVSVKAGSIVLIAANATDLAVYDLHDNAGGDVEVGNVELYPGQMIARSNNNRQPDGLRTLKRIARRPSSEINLKDASGFVSDFSILSALSEMQDLRPLLKANQSNAKHMATAILKNAAIQMQMSSGREGFKASK